MIKNPAFPVFLSLLICSAPLAHAAVTLLPDLIVRADMLKDVQMDSESIPGRVLLRFTTAIANIGAGPLELRGGQASGTGQEVFQRLYESDGSVAERRAGVFLYHPQHHHVHFDGFAAYRLKEVLPGGGVGPSVAEGRKISFCLMDTVTVKAPAPGYFAKRYTECGNGTQGISVGFSDVYGKQLPGQWIDVTDVADGSYWLEVEVNPDGNLVESDRSNNVTRVRVRIGSS